MTSKSKIHSIGRLLRLLMPNPSVSSSSSSSSSSRLLRQNHGLLLVDSTPPCLYHSYTHTANTSRNFCSRCLDIASDSQCPAAIDYRSLLSEGEFHKLADSTIHDLQEKLEEYGDNIQIDGFDVEYGEVLTLKLGDLGTYVLNKQTPNRQLWLSSPMSGPSRFDWDTDAQAWIYRRTKANLLKVLESELRQLCGEPIDLV